MRDFHANLPPTSTVYVGVDLHRRRWHVTARTAEAELFSASIEGTWEALRRVLDRYRGHRVEVVYEAGYFGYWLHDRLVEYGASCVVTPPEPHPAGGRQPRQDRPPRQPQARAPARQGDAQAGLGAVAAGARAPAGHPPPQAVDPGQGADAEPGEVGAEVLRHRAAGASGAVDEDLRGEPAPGEVPEPVGAGELPAPARAV